MLNSDKATNCPTQTKPKQWRILVKDSVTVRGGKDPDTARGGKDPANILTYCESSPTWRLKCWEVVWLEYYS